MFRITKAFENEKTEIYKIEGRIADDLMDTWVGELKRIENSDGKHVILDLGQVWYLCEKAIQTLVREEASRFYLLNCSMEVRNTLQAAGLASRILG